MRISSLEYEQRPKRKWWANVDGKVRPVTGLSCAPSNPAIWWCPEVGYSLTEKHHLFETEREALQSAIDELTAEMVADAKALDELHARLRKAKP